MDDDEETIVINDLLSFLSCKYKAWPFETLLEEVKSFYKEDEIIQAYRTLRESIQDFYELGNDVASSEEALQLIHSCFLNFNKNELPVFVCRNLENIPDLTIVRSEIQQEDDHLQLEKIMSENQLHMKGKITEIVSVVNQLSERLQSFATKVTSLAGKSRTQNDLQRTNRQYLKGQSQRKKKKTNLSHLQNLIDEEDKDVQSTIINEVDAHDLDGDDCAFSSEGEELTGTVIDTKKLRACSKLSNSKNNIKNSNSSSISEGNLKITKENTFNSGLASQKVLHIKSEIESTEDLLQANSDVAEDEKNDFSFTSYISMDDSDQSMEETSIDDETYDLHKRIVNLSKSSASRGASKRKRCLEENQDSALHCCSLCSFSNTNREIVEIHLLSHCGEEASISTNDNYDPSCDDSIQCLLCLQEFSSRPLLNNHTKWCPAIEKKKQDYQPEEKHTCSICGIFFGTLTSLISHKSYHDDVKPFQCSVCGYRFYTQENLDQHFQVHLRPRFQCPYCLHGCTSQFKLNKHVHIHTGYRPFECHLCCFQAEDTLSLNKHLTGHTEINKFPCDVCGKFFESRRLLTIHRSKHPNRTPLICPKCGREFKQISRLKKHCAENCAV